jgi:hypothetical protein
VREASAQLVLGRSVLAPDGGGIGVEREPSPNGPGSRRRVGAGRDLDGQPEAVEELGTQLALFRVHRADQHEARRMLVGDPFALHPIDTRRRDVEKHVDEMVGQQVHLVDVQDPTVRGREQTGFEAAALAGEDGAEVERADEAILGGP